MKDQIKAILERTLCVSPPVHILGEGMRPARVENMDAAAEAIAALFIEHPTSESPDDDRWVLVYTNNQWRRARIQGGHWYGEITPGGLPFYRSVTAWRELPPAPEVAKRKSKSRLF